MTDIKIPPQIADHQATTDMFFCQKINQVSTQFKNKIIGDCIFSTGRGTEHKNAPTE